MKCHATGEIIPRIETKMFYFLKSRNAECDAAFLFVEQ